MPPKTGVESMLGKRGVARSALDPSGMVYLDGAYWTAQSEDGTVEEGEAVVVTAIKGLKLTVKKLVAEGEEPWRQTQPNP
jgi:membrane-bound serine protease (ClpP class)